MNEVLMSDEDMALMYLTAGEQSGGAARDPRQHQEVEMLFENYLFQVRQALAAGPGPGVGSSATPTSHA